MPWHSFLSQIANDADRTKAAASRKEIVSYTEIVIPSAQEILGRGQIVQAEILFLGTTGNFLGIV